MRTKGYNRTSKLYDTFLTVPKYMYSSVFNTYFIFGRGDFEYFKVSGHSRGTRNRHKTSGGGQDQGKRAWDRDPRSCGIRYFSYLSSIIRADQIIVERTVLLFHCIIFKIIIPIGSKVPAALYYTQKLSHVSNIRRNTLIIMSDRIVNLINLQIFDLCHYRIISLHQ